MKACFHLVLSFLALSLVLRSADSQTIKVAGSNFVGFAVQLEGNGERIGNYGVHYRMSGSLLGTLKLKEGLADVAFVLQRPDEFQTLEGLQVIPLGF